MLGKHSRRGFTIIEIVIVLLVGTILTSIAMSSFGSARAPFAVRSARNTFVSLVARARTQAIERGANVHVVVVPLGDSAFIRSGFGGDVQEVIKFDTQFRVDLIAEERIRLCMNSRGYADPDCNSFGSAVKIGFQQNAEVTVVTLLPMGQVIY
jgi:prepilin-type N-terminal cleavage/methylation domain-containing protein